MSIRVKVFPLVQTYSNNPKHILICRFIHGVVCHPTWLLTQFLMKIYEDTINIIKASPIGKHRC